MSGRASTPAKVEADVLMECRRRCCLCVYLDGNSDEQQGQIAHIDRDHRNSAKSNLAFLCIPHHDKYDTTHRQSKGFAESELRTYRDNLLGAVKRGVIPGGTRPPRLSLRATPTSLSGAPLIAFTVENPGSESIRLIAYYMAWDGHFQETSLQHHLGEFPVLVGGQRDRKTFSVPLPREALVTLRELGLLDSDNQRWPVDAGSMAQFDAAAHREKQLTHLRKPVIEKKTLPENALAIIAKAATGTAGAILELSISNKGEMSVCLTRLDLGWEYEYVQPPRGSSPVAVEVGQSMKIGGPDEVLQPGETLIIGLDRDFNPVLVDAARLDVVPGSIKVSVHTREHQAVKIQPEGIVEAIATIARATLNDDRPTPS